MLSIIKVFKIIKKRIFMLFSNKLTKFSFFINRVKYNSFVSSGRPLLEVALSSHFSCGDDFVMVNDAKTATLGKSNRCKFVVYEKAILKIGNKVAMSNATVVATQSVTIGNNVMIGGGVTIVDSDFHSMNPSHWHTKLDEENMLSSAVVIKDNVFIGMDSIILKGVTVGSNVVVAAGSVVSKDIPDNQIWGGNPARFIKEKGSI